MKKYDVVVIGSGPGGEKSALQAAKLKKRVAVVERMPYPGGAGLHTGTLPSKTLRETALFLAATKQRAVFGFQYTLSRAVKLGELMHRKTEVVRKQMEVIIDQFSRNDIEIVYGEASFMDDHRVSVKKPDGSTDVIGADVIVIATGSRPLVPPQVPPDREHIYDSDTILELQNLPSTLTVVGGGVIGCEYACIFACLGVKVTLVENRSDLLPFADREVVTSLKHWMSHSAITLRLGEEVESIKVERPGRVVTELKSGKVVVSEKLLYTMGRKGNTDKLNLRALGIEPDRKGLIKVNENYQTTVPHIYAVGDVIGFPSLAATSREQGRKAICHAFEKETVTCEVPGYLPYGIYTIPEISMVGETEESLTERGVPYETGTAFFHEVARGQIIGDVHGMLKLIFNRDTKNILGVHIIGERASELIHIGQAVMSFGGKIDYFKDVVFNYPTLSDAYKQAALNGINKL